MLPPTGYLEKLQDLCSKWELLLIVDETMTGMGRTGKMFACEHYGIEPDVIIMGKALGAYCPMAAVILAPKLQNRLMRITLGMGKVILDMRWGLPLR